MNNEDVESELRRLNFEDFLYIIFAFLAFINIYGDKNDKEYLKTHNKSFKDKSNTIFEITIVVTFFIYLYYLQRNYKFYQKAARENKNLLFIKLLGSCFLLAGAICLIYFQFKQRNFIGSPAL